MTDLDFIPQTYHEAAARRRSGRTQLVWSAVMAAVMAVWIWGNQVQLARAGQQLEAVRIEQQQLDARRKYFDSLVLERQQLEARDAVQQAVNDPSSWVVVLAELQRCLPQGAMLTELFLEIPEEKPVVESMTVTPVANNGAPKEPLPKPTGPQTWPKLRLVGAAPNNVLVSDFTANLGGSPLFRDVQTGMIKDVVMNKKQVRQFEVQCAVAPHGKGSR